MSVNAMNFEQAGTLLSAINAQATGSTTLAKVSNVGEFISLAQNTRRVGDDPVLKAIGQVLERTIFSDRSYDGRFGSLRRSNDEYGAIMRKISYADKALKENNQAWPYSTGTGTTQLDDGQAVDMYKIWKPDVLETSFFGSAVYEGQYTIFRRQLDVAFSGPSEFSAFMSALMTHFQNERTFWLENLSRMTVVNLIAGKIASVGAGLGTGLVYLGDLAGTTDPDVYNDLVRKAYASIAKTSRKMESRSALYQQPTGKNIYHHTPAAFQRAYISADLMADIEARTLSTTYNDNWLEMVPHESVDFWQNIQSPEALNIDAAYWNYTTKQVVTAAVSKAHVAGVLFDRDACGINIYQNTVEPTPYNPAGEYYNLFAHTRVRLYNDFSEKVAVLLGEAEA